MYFSSTGENVMINWKFMLSKSFRFLIMMHNFSSYNGIEELDNMSKRLSLLFHDIYYGNSMAGEWTAKKFVKYGMFFSEFAYFFTKKILEDFCFYIVMHAKGKKGRCNGNEKERFLPAVYRLSPLSSVEQHMQK